MRCSLRRKEQGGSKAYPGPMVTERTNMGLVYVSLHVKHVEDLRSFMKNHAAAGESVE